MKQYVEGEEEKKNPIRGFLLGFFEPPAAFNGGDQDDDDDEEGGGEVAQEARIGARQRLACWIKISVPCRAKNQNKEVVLAPVGSILWVDVTHSNNMLVLAARPLSARKARRSGLSRSRSSRCGRSRSRRR